MGRLVYVREVRQDLDQVVRERRLPQAIEIAMRNSLTFSGTRTVRPNHGLQGHLLVVAAMKGHLAEEADLPVVTEELHQLEVEAVRSSSIMFVS